MLMRTPGRWVRPKRRQPPGFILPCLPMIADNVPAGDGWVHELKHDGFRIVAFKDGEAVRLWSRNGRDWSAEFVAITAAMRALPLKRIMVDGEAVAHCLDGLPDFHALLGDGQASACLYAFDLLFLETQDVRGVELIGRRRMLQKALRKAGAALRFSEHWRARTGRRCTATPAPWARAKEPAGRPGARMLARSGSHTDHVGIRAELVSSGVGLNTWFDDARFCAQLDKLCALARARAAEQASL